MAALTRQVVRCLLLLAFVLTAGTVCSPRLSAETCAAHVDCSYDGSAWVSPHAESSFPATSVIRAAAERRNAGSSGLSLPVTTAGFAAEGAEGGLSALSQADNYGIWSYRTLRADLKGTGLEAHHLIEQRFAGVLGESPGDMASIAVTGAEHHAFTNAWRRAIPYGEGTRNATPEQIMNAARQIYAGYSDILAALGLG